jgi:site-specific recombinase XerD
MEIVEQIPFTVKFILLPCRGSSEYIVAARILHKRKKALLSMKIKVSKEEWDDKAGAFLPVGRYGLAQNNRLSETIRGIVNAYRQLVNDGAEITAHSIVKRFAAKQAGQNSSKRLTDYYQYHIDEIRQRPSEYSPAVIKHYTMTLGKLTLFLQKKGWMNITLDALTPAFLEHLEQFLMTTPTKSTNRPMQRSSMGRHIKKVRAVVNSAIKRQVIQRNPFAGYILKAAKQSNRHVLTREEYEKLRMHTLGENPALLKIRDCFIFCSETGLRYSDIQQLTKEMISKDDRGVFWITLNQVKTQDNLDIPMTRLAADLYKKYEDHRLKTGKLMPVVSNQKGNTYFKVISELVGIKTITWHSARHYYAVNALEMGVDIATVSALLGHRNIRTTEIYLKITRSRKAEAVEIINRESERRRALQPKKLSPHELN